MFFSIFFYFFFPMFFMFFFYVFFMFFFFFFMGQLHMPWNAGNVMLRHCGFHPTFWVLGDIRGGCICYGMQAMSCFDIAASTPLLGFWGFCGAAAYAMECRQCHALVLRLPPHILISWWIGGGLKWDISGKICFLCLL